MTKAELLGRVGVLEGEVRRLSLGVKAEEHLGRLEAVLAPYLRRLERLPEIEQALAMAREEDEVKGLVAVLKVTRLDAREVGAMNNVLRQIAEVNGVLLGRRAPGGMKPEAEGKAAPVVSRKAKPVGLDVMSNVVQLGKRNA